MTRAVVDANVLVSGFPASHGVPAKLIERWLQRRFEMVLSEHILDGVARAWQRPYWLGTRPSKRRKRSRSCVLRTRATIVVPVATVRGVAKDEEDDLVLATAVAAAVPYLVTGDRFLRDLQSYQGVAIVSPRSFFDLLEQQGREAE